MFHEIKPRRGVSNYPVRWGYSKHYFKHDLQVELSLYGQLINCSRRFHHRIVELTWFHQSCGGFWPFLKGGEDITGFRVKQRNHIGFFSMNFHGIVSMVVIIQSGCAFKFTSVRHLRNQKISSRHQSLCWLDLKACLMTPSILPNRQNA